MTTEEKIKDAIDILLDLLAESKVQQEEAPKEPGGFCGGWLDDTALICDDNLVWHPIDSWVVTRHHDLLTAPEGPPHTERDQIVHIRACAGVSAHARPLSQRTYIRMSLVAAQKLHDALAQVL